MFLEFNQMMSKEDEVYSKTVFVDHNDISFISNYFKFDYGTYIILKSHPDDPIQITNTHDEIRKILSLVNNSLPLNKVNLCNEDKPF